MTILWVGGEDLDFLNGAALTSSSGGVRAGYARVSLSATNVSTFIKSSAFPGGALTSLWFSCQGNFAGMQTNNGYLGVGLLGTNKGLFVGCSSSTSKLALLTYDGASWAVLASEAGNTISGGMHKIDMQIINYGANSTVYVYFDGILLISFVDGDCTVADVVNLNSVFCWKASGASSVWASEFIVADEDTRLFSVVTMAPNLAGDANAWTGLYSDIDETNINDADVLYVNSAAQAAQFNLNTIPAGTFTVRHIKVSARIAKTASATAGTVKLGIKTGATADVDGGHAGITAWVTHERDMAQNPVTTNDWQSSEMADLQIAFESAA